MKNEEMKNELTTQVETESMFLLTTFLAIPVNKAFLLVSVCFGTQTTLSLGLVFVLLLPRRITRLCGGVMDQQAVSAHHNAP